MKYRLFFGMFIIACVNQSHGDNTFRSQEGQFSFHIPSGWHCISIDKWIPSKQIIKDSEEDIIYMICKLKESKDLTPPFVLFYIEKCNLNERQLEERFSSNEEQEKLKSRSERRFEIITSFRDWNLPIWQDTKLLDYSTKYDVSLHRNIERFIFLNSDSKKMEIGVLTILGNGKITTLQYCLNCENIDNDDTTSINEIINSFEYNKGFGYGQRNLPYEKSKKEIEIQKLVRTRRVILIILWIGLLCLCGFKLFLAFIVKKCQGQIPAWVKTCLAAWFQVFGSFILFIAVICGYFELWIDFGVALTVGAVFCIRGFFEKFIVLRNNSPDNQTE